MSKGKERNLSQVAGSPLITSLINSFELKNYIKVDCAFHWAEQDSKVLSQLAWIVFAVPMTQEPVERLFSGVKFILSDLRNSRRHFAILAPKQPDCTWLCTCLTHAQQVVESCSKAQKTWKVF